MSCGSSVGCLEKDDDSGQKRQRKGHKSQWHLTSLALTPGLTSQFGAVFLGPGSIPTARRFKAADETAAPVDAHSSGGGGLSERGLCSRWQQDKTSRAVFTLRSRGQRGRERPLRCTAEPPFIPGEESNRAGQLQQSQSQLLLRLPDSLN